MKELYCDEIKNRVLIVAILANIIAMILIFAIAV